MTINVLEDLSRSERDAKYKRIIKQHEQMRVKNFHEVTGQNNLERLTTEIQRPTTDAMEKISDEFKNLMTPGQQPQTQQTQPQDAQQPQKPPNSNKFQNTILTYVSYMLDKPALRAFTKSIESLDDRADVTIPFSKYLIATKNEQKIDNKLGFRVGVNNINLGRDFANIVFKFYKGKDMSLYISYSDGNEIRGPVILSAGLFYLLRYTNHLSSGLVHKRDLRVYHDILEFAGYPRKILTARGKFPSDWTMTRKSEKYVKYAKYKTAEKGKVYDALIPPDTGDEVGPSKTPQSGAGMDNISSSKTDNMLKANKEGKFGSLYIDMNKLRSKFVLIATKNGKQKLNIKLTKKQAEDLYDLLTKRFNTKKSYTGKSLQVFEDLRNKSDLPVIGVHSHKKNLTGNSHQYYDDADLKRKLEILIASHRAGSDSPKFLEEITSILDVMLGRKIIDIADYKTALKALKQI